MTNEQIDRILADFRGWLHAAKLPETPPAPEPEPVSLHTLLAQFTALRHEVNLQTKAGRAATDQVAEVLKRIGENESEVDADDDEIVLPLAKTITDIADALALSHRQVERAKETMECLLIDPPPSSEAATGFFARWFVKPPAPSAATPLSDKLRPLLAGVADGYALSLRRVERALPQFGLEPIDCLGQPFDPEQMEAVEVVDPDGRPSGIVAEEVRRGYRRNGKPFRFALVKVTR